MAGNQDRSARSSERAVAKRGELAGQVQPYHRQLQRLADELDHLDATIRLFVPEYDLVDIRPRTRLPGRRCFGSGECQRLVLEVLRDAEGPLSGPVLTQAVATRKGLPDRPEVLAVLQKTTLAVVAASDGQGRSAGDGLG